MQAVLFIALIGLAGGIAVGVQSPLASMIGQRLGVVESIFFVHFGGAVAAGLILLFMRGGKLADWHTVPWYALAAGLLGLIVIGSVNFAIPQIGAVGTIILVVAGQLLIGVAIDHFGWLETEVRTLDLQRIIGIAVMFLGVWLILRK